VISTFNFTFLIPKYSQSTDNSPTNQRLNATNNRKQDRCDPYQLPIAPLDNAGPERDDEMYAANEQQGPVDSEAENVARVVEVVGRGGAGGERPVERGEDGGDVAGRLG
jgi:hypothetical protein